MYSTHCCRPAAPIVTAHGRRVDRLGVAIGVDTHKDTLAACLVDGLGIARDEQAFRNDPAGHAAFAAWVRGQEGPGVRVGIEGSASFGAVAGPASRRSRARCRRGPAPLSRRERGRTRRPGKSDPGDAFAIARVTCRRGGPAPSQAR